jgi:hypothetical protein
VSDYVFLQSDFPANPATVARIFDAYGRPVLVEPIPATAPGEPRQEEDDSFQRGGWVVVSW